jgi:putative colanic acid biosynthesis glycosyltransferase WcaI
MRVLLLSQWYPPEPDAKTHLIGRGLARRGHTVTALTGFPNYPSGSLYPGYRMRWRRFDHIDGVRVIRVPLYPDHGTRLGPRIANYASFAASASVLGPALVSPADVMWVYQGPLTIGMPALALSALRRVPYVLGISDVWPEILAATGVVRSELAARAAGAFASTLYARARAITVISPGFKRDLVAKGVDPAKIHYISDWVDEAVYAPAPRDERLARELGFDGRFVVLYAGNMGPAQDLENVIRAAALLRDDPQILIGLAGDGVDEPRLRALSAQLGLANVRFLGRLPASRMPPLYAIADALLVNLRSDRYYQMAIPSKLIAYLACGRPILCAATGDSADLVTANGAGASCAPGDPTALADAIRRLRAAPTAARDEMAASALALYRSSFTNQKVLDAYENLFVKIASATR